MNRQLFRLAIALLLLGLACLDQSRGQLVGCGPVAGKMLLFQPCAVSAGTTPTTWNPADKNAGITLTNGNLTATNNSGTSAGVRTVDSISGSQKIYWELTITVDDVTLSPGVANATWDLTTTLRGTTNGIGTRDDGNTLLNFANVGCQSFTYTNGSNLAWALDFANKKLWIGPNTGGTPWCNDVIGNQNPATNTGGADISSLTGALFPAMLAITTTDAVTAIFSSASWLHTPPSGFVQLGH